jgi:hypothetical protein
MTGEEPEPVLARALYTHGTDSRRIVTPSRVCQKRVTALSFRELLRTIACGTSKYEGKIGSFWHRSLGIRIINFFRLADKPAKQPMSLGCSCRSLNREFALDRQFPWKVL